MALPSKLQSLLQQFKPAAQPLFICSSLFAVLCGIFLWQYTTNPEWFGAYEDGGSQANEDVDLSGLTPEEQARLANIDNLTVLNNDLNAGNPEAASQLVTPDDLSLLQALLGSTPGEGNATDNIPLERYLNDYRFSGGPPAGTGTTTAATSTGNLYNALFGAGTPSRGGLGSALLSGGTATGESARPGSDGAAVSPLEAALRRNSSDAEADAAAAAEANGESPNANAAPSGVPGRTGRANTVTLPGVGTFLPTTPDMSPPPGTTGYTPPTSFQFTNPGPSLPSGPALNNGLGGGGINFNPSVNPSGGGNLPSGGNASGVTNPSPLPAPTSPYSVPRPPGSYIGGGYINTFSNPSAAPGY